MKKLLKILICFLLLMTLFIVYVEVIDPGPTLELDTPEKIAEVYYANEAYFNAAAAALLRYDEKDLRISIVPIEEAESPTVYVGKEINDLYIKSTRALTEDEYQILSGAFAPLIGRCCDAAGVEPGSVSFCLEGPIYGKTANLYYRRDTDTAKRDMSSDFDHILINPNWVAEISHD